MFKLFFAPLSPFVRKVLVTAYETQQDHLIERILSAPHPLLRDQAIAEYNPLGQAPTAIDADGRVLYGSRVICEYLDDQSTNTHVFPRSGVERWNALVQQALGDGILDAALLARYEVTIRPSDLQWAAWRDMQIIKIEAALDEVERTAPDLEGAVTIGTITIACAIGYLDLRFAELDWRARRPMAAQWYDGFAQRASMIATRPQG